MVELSVIRDLVAIFGVIAGFIYYALTVRTNQKNQKLQLETRQAQFMSMISQDITSRESMRNNIETINMDWTDWQDFDKKYDSSVNPESASMRLSILNKFENVGWLLEKGMLDPDWCYSQFHMTLTPLWIKYEPYVMQLRKKYNSPTIFIGFEYLGRKFADIEKSKGIQADLDMSDMGLSIKNS